MEEIKKLKDALGYVMDNFSKNIKDFSFPEEFEKTMYEIYERTGKEPVIYGGFVRDMAITGETPKDLDVAFMGKCSELNFLNPEELYKKRNEYSKYKIYKCKENDFIFIDDAENEEDFIDKLFESNTVYINAGAYYPISKRLFLSDGFLNSLAFKTIFLNKEKIRDIKNVPELLTKNFMHYVKTILKLKKYGFLYDENEFNYFFDVVRNVPFKKKNIERKRKEFEKIAKTEETKKFLENVFSSIIIR